MPLYLVGRSGAPGSFQCEKCFYPGTGRAPERSNPVASDRMRFLTSFAERGGGQRPAPPNPDDD